MPPPYRGGGIGFIFGHNAHIIVPLEGSFQMCQDFRMSRHESIPL